jgi:hypothetical protein
MTKTQIDTAAALGNVKINSAALAWFKPYLSGWLKGAGSKPTDAMLTVPLVLGKRAGVEALHIAMCLRPEGCTVQQFCLAGSCGPANNYRRALVKSGWFGCTVEGKPYAFKLAFTVKGEAKLTAMQAKLDVDAQAADAVPVAKKRKAGKAKRKAADTVNGETATPVAGEPETPASEPATGNEGHNSPDTANHATA